MPDHHQPSGTHGAAPSRQLAVSYAPSVWYATLKLPRYGVSRVYLQQCGYVLADAQSVQNTMRMMLRTVKNAALDPNAGKARFVHSPILNERPLINCA